MSEQSLSNGETHSESDLYIFKGMEGFEESDDSALVALLDDLHEDTLLTLLDDNLFVKELCECPFEGEDESQHNPSLQENSGPLCNDAMYSQYLEVDEASVMKQSDECENRECPRSVTQHLEGNKRLRNDNIHEITPKKVKLDGSTKQSSALASVMHDHCYVSLYEDQHNSNANSDEETSNEEGSSSDTGKDLNSVTLEGIVSLFCRL